MKQPVSLCLFVGALALCGLLVIEADHPELVQSLAPPPVPLMTRTVVPTHTTPSADDAVPVPPLPVMDTPAPAPAVAAPTARTEPPAKKCRKVTAIVTGYCPCRHCCGSGSPGITSTGSSAWVPGAAADPQALPYGKRVFIPDYGWTTIDDTGGAMRRNWSTHGRIQIDVRFKYHWTARQWGRRIMTVLVED